MEQVKLTVSGMSCQGCADSLNRLFKEEPGISDSAVSFDDKAASVTFDPDQVSQTRLGEIVEAAGFSVQ